MRTLDLDLRIEELAREYAAARAQIATHPLYLRHLAGELIFGVEGYSDFEKLVHSSEEVVTSLKEYDIPVQLPISSEGLKSIASTAALKERVPSSSLENIPGNLKDACKLSVPGKNRHVDEIMTERRTNEELRKLWFYTADGELYFMDGGKPKLAMTREPDNLVLRHIDDAFTQLTSGGNYVPHPAEAERAIKASTTEVFDLTKLNPKKYDNEFSFIEVSTTNYNSLNPEQRRLAERVYGKGNDFVLNMAMLKQSGINTTRVYVLDPEYVKEHANRGPIGRGSWLNNFYSDSSFIANDRNINNRGRLRGVRR